MQKQEYPILLFNSIMNAFKLLFEGHFSVLYDELKKRVSSESFSFGLKRDLTEPFESPSAKINIHIRELVKSDLGVLLAETKTSNPRVIAGQRALAEASIPTCYVAVTTNNIPCYMQWMIGSEDNERIEGYFQGVFPSLKPHEALLEAAYGNPDFRGLNIMPEAMSRIAEKAALNHVRWVITFVGITNIPSLKGCLRSGFKPYILRKDNWFLFRRTTSFLPLSEEIAEEYHRNPADKAQLNRKSIQPQFQS